MGDPAGIGPEVCWKGITPKLLDLATISIVGDQEIIEESKLLYSQELSERTKEVSIFPTENSSFKPLERCRPSGASGECALKAIQIATDICLNNKADAMVTAPVSKEAIEMSGTPFTGHTEWISNRCGNHDEMMMMSDLSQKLHVGYLTTHVPLAKLPSLITTNLIQRRLEQCLSFRDLIRDPRPIAICGLNPHAGENGLLGTEEEDIIKPVIQKLQQTGHPIEGPFPADTLFVKNLREKFSILLALYHDQGGIPFKMLAFDQGVNHTLGLPIIRTSVDHGTAWDIAWKGQASGKSMTAAIELALLRAEAGWKEQVPHHNTKPNTKVTT